MLKLKRGNTTPPDLFTYRFPQDQYLAKSYNYDAWMGNIKKHAVDNGYPIPTIGEVEDQLCRRLSGEWCTGGGPHSFVNTRFTLNDFIRGTKVLAAFALSGAVVSKEVAEQRALICSRCPLNVPVPGCASCNAMANMVTEIKGAKSTKYDHLLKACGICKCPNEAQAWVPAEFLSKGVDHDMMETYREIDECWKWKEIDEYRG